MTNLPFNNNCMLFCTFQHFSGLEEAVYRNIQACKELAQTTRTAYGPNGMIIQFKVVHENMFNCSLLCSWCNCSNKVIAFVGMNKMVINHLEKLYVTNDAATILQQLEVGG